MEDDRSIEASNEDVAAIHKLDADNSQELYSGCFTSNFLEDGPIEVFDLSIDLLVDALPKGSTLPRNFHEAKKMVKYVANWYTNIYACENDCILFWKEHEELNSCPKCNVSCWKSDKKSINGKHEYKVPRKVLRYFPIKKRPQRLFVSSKTASTTWWHDECRKIDGLLRHPLDSPLWKDFYQEHPEFATDSCNIRLAFVAYGFNPYRTMNISYSIWPSILIPFNFPSSMCMKDSNFILFVLIPQDVGTPRLKCYSPTRLQMEIFSLYES
jgi:hypothetical protein